MKKIKLTLICLLLVVSINTFAQECDKLLQGGLYSFTQMTNTGSFSQDLRTYYLSEQFKLDMKSGKWGGSVTIPIEGIPVSLGIDFTETKYNEFRSKILAVSELNISQNFYQTSFSSIPNVNLYQAFVECVRIKEDVSKTGFIQGMNIETEDVVVFNFYYRPQAPGDPMPVVSSFNVQPEGSVISGALTVGQTLNSFSFVVTTKRDPEKDLVLSLQTNRGLYASKSSAEGAFSTSKEFPIGTIITSVLNFEQFSFTSKNNEKSPGGLWTSGKSKWAPCDGRPLPSSKFSKISSQTNAPDYRGIFLRGLNSFDPTYTILPSNPAQLNPDNTAAGIYQADGIKEHSHNVSGNTFTFVSQHPSDRAEGGSDRPLSFPNQTQTVTVRRDGEGLNPNETRPKSISVYYYVKIN